jgi:hypothetical protein
MAVPVAIDAERGQIKRRTAKGLDATGSRFPRWEDFHAQESEDVHGGEKGGTYSPGQEKKREEAGLVTDIKTMEFSGATMESLGRYNENELTVDEDHMPIMLGQMKHSKWQYHHNVLGVNVKEDIPVMEKALELMLHTTI